MSLTSTGARALLVLGDSVTTDHICPAGRIPADSPAGVFLLDQGEQDLNTYASRRGNHEVMIRGAFANQRLRNGLVPDRRGGWTLDHLDGVERTIYDATERYRAAAVPLVVLAGKEYGTGSSRDWAAKGTALLGVRAVIAETYERIHRSNLIGLGVLPLQFLPGDSVAALRLTGHETFDIEGLAGLDEHNWPRRARILAVRDDVRVAVRGRRETRHGSRGPVLPARGNPALRRTVPADSGLRLLLTYSL